MLLAVCGWCSTFHIVTSLGKEILFRILSLDMESCSAAFLPRSKILKTRFMLGTDASLP
ncbi:hypothetical protein HMPREF3293_00430 [Christensenella minuta]|uniref:Uncharacterized protein n=1 Tax=Christensenella minuta TaxID=626937 RepID=A0A136Q7Y7_9FIRM|nr:hypothetical protein HMPREF3293_00430 [Christensenella minuta]